MILFEWPFFLFGMTPFIDGFESDVLGSVPSGWTLTSTSSGSSAGAQVVEGGFVPGLPSPTSKALELSGNWQSSGQGAFLDEDRLDIRFSWPELDYGVDIGSNLPYGGGFGPSPGSDWIALYGVAKQTDSTPRDLNVTLGVLNSGRGPGIFVLGQTASRDFAIADTWTPFVLFLRLNAAWTSIPADEDLLVTVAFKGHEDPSTGNVTLVDHLHLGRVFPLFVTSQEWQNDPFGGMSAFAPALAQRGPPGVSWPSGGLITKPARPGVSRFRVEPLGTHRVKRGGDATGAPTIEIAETEVPTHRVRIRTGLFTERDGLGDYSHGQTWGGPTNPSFGITDIFTSIDAGYGGIGTEAWTLTPERLVDGFLGHLHAGGRVAFWPDWRLTTNREGHFTNLRARGRRTRYDYEPGPGRYRLDMDFEAMKEVR